MHKKTLLLLALAALAPPGHAADVNLVDQLEEGGAAILVTLGLSILFVAVTIERLLHFRARAIVPDGLLEQVKPLWAMRDHAMLHSVLEQNDSTLARIIAFMAAHRDQPHSFISSGALAQRMDEFLQAEFEAAPASLRYNLAYEPIFNTGIGSIPYVRPGTAKGSGRMLGAGGRYAERVYLNNWYLIGPFPGRHGKGLFKNLRHPPEDACCSTRSTTARTSACSGGSTLARPPTRCSRATRPRMRSGTATPK